MHEVLVNRLGGLSLPRKSVVRLTDRPDMTLDVYRGRKTTTQQQQQQSLDNQTVHNHLTRVPPVVFPRFPVNSLVFSSGSRFPPLYEHVHGLHFRKSVLE